MGSKTTAVSGICLALALAWGTPAHAEAQKDKSLEDLIRSVESKEGGVRPQGSRSSAIRELVRREDSRGIDAILELFADAYAHQREVVLLAVAKNKNDEFLSALAARAMRNKDELTRSGVTRALGLTGRTQVIDAILQMQRDRSPLVQQAVAEALGRFGRAEDLAVLSTLGKSKDPAVRAAVAQALIRGAQQFGEPASAEQAQELATRLTGDRDGVVSSLGIEALACVAGPSSLEKIAEVAQDRKSEPARIGALLAYRQLAAGNDTDSFEAAVAASLAAFADKSWRVRAAAIDNAVELWDERFIEPLISLMKEEDGRLRLDCAFALTLLCGKDMGTDASGWANWWDVRKQDFEMPRQPKRQEYGFERSLEVEEGSSSFFDIPVLSKRCIFQFDFSGSMAWEIEDYRKDKGRTVSADEKTTVTKLSIAQDEAAAVVGELAPDAIFNFQIYRYRGARNPPQVDTESAFKRLAPASKKNRAAAKKWVTSREVDGWGAFYNALVSAMDDEDVDTVFLLSDGSPSGGERVDDDRFVQGIADLYRGRRVTIHTILLKNNDDGHNKYAIRLMEDIARATGGLCVLR